MCVATPSNQSPWAQVKLELIDSLPCTTPVFATRNGSQDNRQEPTSKGTDVDLFQIQNAASDRWPNESVYIIRLPPTYDEGSGPRIT